MQTQNIVVFVSLIALNIFVLEVKCWLIFDDSSDNAIDTNTLELSNELGRYIIRRDSNSINDYPPPSYDTLSNRCQCSCGEVNYATKIFGGKKTEINVYPWMANLSYLGRFFCTGSLINDRYVLSAAHCVKGFWFLIKVTFGEYDRCKTNSEPESRFVLRVISRPYNFLNYDDDIALLRLNDRVPINHIIQPICLPDRRASHYAGQQGIVTGWNSMTVQDELSCMVQDVKVSILTNLECVHVQSNRYKSAMVTENMMCAGYPDDGKDSCQGEFGGALMVKRNDQRLEMAGIVSWGTGCARSDFPGVYTRVARYVDWIQQNTRDACYCQD